MSENPATADPQTAALDFLSRVLPENGSLFAFCKLRNRTVFCRSLSEIWETANQERNDCWYSTAAFKDNTSRRADNVLWKQEYYTDLDYGPDKPYKTPKESLQALVAFLPKAKLPAPIIVSTGHGFHLHWPLLEPVPLDVWKRTAEGLKLAMASYGFACDPVCTADAARLLRIPGTLNYKDKSRPMRVTVQAGFRAIGPYTQSQFEHLVSSNVVAFPKPQVTARTVYNEQTKARVLSALKALPVAYRDDRDKWFRIGAALFELGWGDRGFKIWLAWSYTSPKFDMKVQIRTWESFARGFPGDRITPGTLYALARENGWHDAAATVDTSIRDEAERRVTWDMNRFGERKPTFRNCLLALSLLGVKCKYDALRGRKEVVFPHDNYAGKGLVSFDDNLAMMIRAKILETYSFDCGSQNVHDAITKACVDNEYDPLVKYIDGLEWDGVSRIKDWMARYFGAQETKLNDEIGRLTLVAAIRRALDPGCKYDHMLILCGRQGTGKSTAVRIMGREQFYSDQHIHVHDNRTVIEAVRGVWVYEWSELAGFSSANSVERLKAVITTQIDKGRMAYGRETTLVPRRTIFIGTTNYTNRAFLYDETGARRFFPVITGSIDTAALARDMDQLYAEAKTLSDTYGPLTLKREVIKDAQAMQANFNSVTMDYEDALVNFQGEEYFSHKERWPGRKTTTTQVYAYLGIQPKEQTRYVALCVGNTMRKLGWERLTVKHDGKTSKGWIKYDENTDS